MRRSDVLALAVIAGALAGCSAIIGRDLPDGVVRGDLGPRRTLSFAAPVFFHMTRYWWTV